MPLRTITAALLLLTCLRMSAQEERIIPEAYAPSWVSMWCHQGTLTASVDTDDLRVEAEVYPGPPKPKPKKAVKPTTALSTALLRNGWVLPEEITISKMLVLE